MMQHSELCRTGGVDGESHVCEIGQHAFPRRGGDKDGNVPPGVRVAPHIEAARPRCRNGRRRCIQLHMY
jgi:hypothetical protein